MSELPTAEQIAEWTRLDAATAPGPWRLENDSPHGNVVNAQGELVALVYASDGRAKRWWWECETNTRAFIAASRTAVPSLLAALSAERARADRAEETLRLTRDGADLLVGAEEARQALEEKLREACGGSDPSDGHDYADEVIGLLRVTRGQREAAERDAASLREERDELAGTVLHLMRRRWTRHMEPDHACVACIGSGPMVIDGFRCRYHRALDLVHEAALSAPSSSPPASLETRPWSGPGSARLWSHDGSGASTLGASPASLSPGESDATTTSNEEG